MTRLPTQHLMPSAPQSVVFGELAVAASFAGHSVALVFQDYVGPILGEIWRNFGQGLGPHEVVHVRTQADVRRLSEHLDGVRLAFVHTPRLYDAVMWCIQMAPPMPGTIVPRPAVFARDVPENASPGAALILRCDERESVALAHWPHLEGQVWENLQAPAAIQMEPALIPLLTFTSTSRTDGAWSIRRRQILQSLLVGAGLRRACQQDAWAGEAVQVTFQDYALVRNVLQSRLVTMPDASVDRIAVAMVSRANVYLDVKYGPDQTDANPFPADEYYDRDGPVLESRGRPLVTRREIADLGNVRSGMVRRLIEQLQRRPDGFEQFARMGLTRRLTDHDDWSRTPAGRLAGFLWPWSVKQVRTHFENLHRSGLITAERDPQNGPWRYLLPEEFSATGITFADLPPAEQLSP